MHVEGAVADAPLAGVVALDGGDLSRAGEVFALRNLDEAGGQRADAPDDVDGCFGVVLQNGF